jgi:hypothetical protein
MRAVLLDVAAEFDGRRVPVIGHSARHWALDHLVSPLEELITAPSRGGRDGNMCSRD